MERRTTQKLLGARGRRDERQEARWWPQESRWTGESAVGVGGREPPFPHMCFLGFCSAHLLSCGSLGPPHPLPWCQLSSGAVTANPLPLPPEGQASSRVVSPGGFHQASRRHPAQTCASTEFPGPAWHTVHPCGQAEAARCLQSCIIPWHGHSCQQALSCSFYVLTALGMALARPPHQPFCLQSWPVYPPQ